jgi:hypothetical protein
MVSQQAREPPAAHFDLESGIATSVSRWQDKRRCFAWISMTVLLLIGAMIANVISGDELSARTRSIMNGLCLIIVTITGLWISIRYCSKPQEEQPALLTFSWARMTLPEAIQWKKLAAVGKPIVRYELHTINSCATKSGQVIRPSATLEYAQGFSELKLIVEEVPEKVCGITPNILHPDALEVLVDKIDTLVQDDVDKDESQPNAEQRLKCSEAQSESIQRPSGDEVPVSPRSSSTGSESSMCCPCCLGDMQDSPVIALLQCGHLFCEECLQAWAAKSAACPYCRKSMLA